MQPLYVSLQYRGEACGMEYFTLSDSPSPHHASSSDEKTLKTLVEYFSLRCHMQE